MTIVVVAELVDRKPRAATLHAIELARRLADARGVPWDVLVLGQGAGAAAEALAGYGARQVLVADHAELAEPVAERFVRTVAAVAATATVVVGAATSWGRELLPRVAGRCGGAYAGDCADAAWVGERIEVVRPMFAGNLRARCVLESPLAVLTVRPSEVAAAERRGGAEF